jgi:glycolate oxidase FAD binding subunit
MSAMAMTDMPALDLAPFAAAIGSDGPVTIAGHGTRGGAVSDIRIVHAPSGIAWYKPEEMTLCCGAGTSVDELVAAVGAAGQVVPFPDGGTVGGALATSAKSLYRLGLGPVRDSVLQVRFVNAEGKVAKAGGPVVKNVSGFDLCRLLVGSHGTLGFLGEVVLRTKPAGRERRWYRTEESPAAVRPRLYRPAAVLWDGVSLFVCLDGHPTDLDAEAASAGLSLADGPPALPPHRWSLSSADAAAWLARGVSGPFVAELGVGTVHASVAAPVVAPSDSVRGLHHRLKTLFDPTGRLNPGRMPFGLDGAS